VSVTETAQRTVPISRSLAAVLRDALTSDDDAARLLVGTLVSAFGSEPDRSLYVTVSIAGQNLKVPYLTSSRLYAYPANTPVYMLATRTSLLALGALGTAY